MESKSRFEKMGLKTDSEEAETEAGKQLKLLLRKQLSTDTDLESELKKKKEFISSANYKPSTEKFVGEVSFNEFSAVDKKDRQYEKYKECGLTDTEVQIKLQASKKSLAIPEVQKQRLEDIEMKIKSKREELEISDKFSGKIELGRHEMDLERSLMGKVGSEKAQVFKTLTRVVKTESSNLSKLHPVHHLKNMADSFSGVNKRKSLQNMAAEFKREGFDDFKTFKEKFHMDLDFADEASPKKIKTDSKSEEIEHQPKPITCAHNFVGPVIPTTIDNIEKNRITIEEIRQIPHFSNYTPGEESNILYLKNLPKNVTESDLASIFVHFDKVEGRPTSKILYRVLTGRMKGQAFVTFENNVTAKRAFELVNGYKMNDRPVIIQYGKGKL